MKKLFILFYGVFSLACFAATDNQEISMGGGHETIVSEESEAKIGWFFGGGIGTGIETFTDSKLGLRNSFYSVVASAKIGGYYYFTRFLGLRYYYSYDVSFNPKLHRNGDIIQGVNGVDASSIFKYHTFNIDAIFNAYSNETIAIGFLGGIGAGLRSGKMIAKRNDTYLPLIPGGISGYPIFVEGPVVRLNAGMRVLLNRQYGIEFLANFPLNPSVLQETQRTKAALVKPYYFTLNFVMEL